MTSLTNTAAVTDDGANGVDPDLSDNTATDTDTVSAAPDLRVAKDDGIQVRSPADSFSYSLTVTNAGNQNATGVTLVDTLPAGLTFTSATAGGTQSPPGTITWALGAVAGNGGSTVVSVTVRVLDPAPAGVNTLVNSATVADDGANGTDPTPGDNTDTDTDSLSALPGLSISKTDGVATLRPGATTTYTLTVRNTGDQDATGVAIVDTLPTALTFESCSDSCDSSAAPSLSWPLVDLASGATTTRTVTASLPASVAAGLNSVTNSAAVTDDGANGVDADLSDNSAIDVDVVDAAPDLRITKTDGQDHLEGGSTATYTLTTSNVGDQDATGVIIGDTLPGGMSFVSCSDSCNSVAAPTITWPSIPLAAGSSVTRTITVTVDSPVAPSLRLFVNTASVADDGTNGSDPTPADNITVDTDTSGVDLGVTKTNGVTETVPGATTTYTLVVANNGPSTISGFTLTDPLPTILTAPTYQPSRGSYAPETGAWTGLTFQPGQTVTLSISATVEASATGALVNATRVRPPAGYTDPVPSNDSATDTDTLTPRATLRATKRLSGELVAGAEATYVITVINDGPSVATAVTAADNLPAGLIPVRTSGAGWTCTITLGKSSCLHADLTPGTTSSDLVVRAKVSAAPGSNLVNEARVVSATPAANGNGVTTAVAGATETAQVLSADQLAATGLRAWGLMRIGLLLLLVGVMVLARRPRRPS